MLWMPGRRRKLPRSSLELAKLHSWQSWQTWQHKAASSNAPGSWWRYLPALLKLAGASHEEVKAAINQYWLCPKDAALAARQESRWASSTQDWQHWQDWQDWHDQPVDKVVGYVDFGWDCANFVQNRVVHEHDIRAEFEWYVTWAEWSAFVEWLLQAMSERDATHCGIGVEPVQNLVHCFGTAAARLLNVALVQMAIRPVTRVSKEVRSTCWRVNTSSCGRPKAPPHEREALDSHLSYPTHPGFTVLQESVQERFGAKVGSLQRTHAQG